MYKRGIILTIVFLLSINYAFACTEGGGRKQSIKTQCVVESLGTESYEATDDEIGALSSEEIADNWEKLKKTNVKGGKKGVGALTEDQIKANLEKIKSDPEASKQLTDEQLGYVLENGNTLLEETKLGDVNEEARDKALKNLVPETKGEAKPEIKTEVAPGQDSKVERTGPSEKPTGFKIDQIQSIGVGDTVFHGVTGFSFVDGVISVKESKRIDISKGALANVLNFVGDKSKFHVGSAEDVVSDCLTLRDVKNSDFTVSQNTVLIEPSANEKFDIADCSFAQSNFEAYSENSQLAITKDRPARYEISNGKLTHVGPTSKETVEADDKAAVQYGENGFSEVILISKATYWYNNDKIEQDFGIHTVKEDETYKICLKKSETDQLNACSAIVDFVDNKIAMKGSAQYLKYPFKNNEIASLLTNTLYQGSDGIQATMQLDETFTLVDVIQISGQPAENTSIVATTNPSNYYQIKEQQIKNKIHRLIKINKNILKSDLTDNRIKQYQSTYFAPILQIQNNIATQSSQTNTITILPPEHDFISRIIDSQQTI